MSTMTKAMLLFGVFYMIATCSLKTIVMVVGVLVLSCWWIVYNQESMLYMPEIQGLKVPNDNPQGLKSPADQGLFFEDLKLKLEGENVEVHAWFIPAPGETSVSRSAPTLLFCHENAGNIGLRCQEYKAIAQRMCCNQLVFDYRGYGLSTGTPGEEGLVRDAVRVYEWLCERASSGGVDASKIFICGRSLGGAATVQVGR
jgi:hypothetical protein